MAENVRTLFVESARVVDAAIADDIVARAWDEPSILDDQLVGGLAGHLARGGVWVVDDYLDAEIPDAPHAASAAEYYARVTASLGPEEHRQIRERGSQIAAQGHAAVCEMLRARLDALEVRLGNEPGDRLVGVAGGAAVMPLDAYLETRILEQVVHLDDLARSVGREPWSLPEEAERLVIHVGIEIARVRHGAPEVIRCLYRSRLDPVLPVL
jgi:hypothetical protein